MSIKEGSLGQVKEQEKKPSGGKKEVGCAEFKE